jgi:hypothetical protein
VEKAGSQRNSHKNRLSQASKLVKMLKIGPLTTRLNESKLTFGLIDNLNPLTIETSGSMLSHLNTRKCNANGFNQETSNGKGAGHPTIALPA